MFVYSYAILKCDLRVQIGKLTKMHGGDHYIFRHFCIFLQLYLSNIHTKYVKQQVILCSTTLVYHSHIEKCYIEVETLNELSSWRPFWKICCNLFSSPNKPFHSSSFRYRLTYIDRYVINSGCVMRKGYFYPNQSRRLKM